MSLEHFSISKLYLILGYRLPKTVRTYGRPLTLISLASVSDALTLSSSTAVDES